MTFEVTVDTNLECFGEEGVIRVCGCDNGEVTIETTLKPDGAADPEIAEFPNGAYYVRPTVKGTYQFEVTCCGSD